MRGYEVCGLCSPEGELVRYYLTNFSDFAKIEFEKISKSILRSRSERCR